MVDQRKPDLKLHRNIQTELSNLGKAEIEMAECGRDDRDGGSLAFGFLE